MTINRSTSTSRSTRAASKALAASVVVAPCRDTAGLGQGCDLVLAQAEMLAQLKRHLRRAAGHGAGRRAERTAERHHLALVERGETIGLDIGTLEQWRVAVAERPTLEFDGRRFIAVAGLPGARANLEQKTPAPVRQPAAPNSSYAKRSPWTTAVRAPLAPRPLAGFLNYTLFGYQLVRTELWFRLLRGSGSVAVKVPS